MKGSVAPSTNSNMGEVVLAFVDFLHELDADEDAAGIVQVGATANLNRVLPHEIERTYHVNTTGAVACSVDI